MLENNSIYENLPKNLDKQWAILSRAILDNLKQSPELRKEVLGWSKFDISDYNAFDFLNSGFSFDFKVNKIITNYNDELIKILGINSFKDKIDGKDVNNSSLNTIEKDLTIKRYSYSRDINMLFLASEFLESNIDLNEKENIILKSGINITNNIDNIDDVNTLLNIENWNGRKKIKDRVYEITIGKKRYILKEKKTKFHCDTFKCGHIDGLTSLEEFNVAKKINSESHIIDPIFCVKFEKPISTVSFPDGYQFSIFEYDDIMEYDGVNIDILSKEIFNNKDQFFNDYLKVLDIYKNFLDDEKIIFHSSFFDNKGFFSKLRNKFKGKNKFSYKDYSYVKANHLLGKESLIYENTLLKYGYFNDDGCQYNTKLTKNENGEIELEMFIYDFEYFLKVKDSDIDIMLSENISNYKKYDFGIYRQYRELDGSFKDAFAASFALKELDDLV